MAKVQRCTWSSSETGLSRRDRASCTYDAYLPDPLGDRMWRLDGDVVADVVDAERALAEFDARAVALADTEALARLLLRAESVASSRIEGLDVGGRRLLRAEAAAAAGAASSDVTADEVLRNIDAMAGALVAVRPSQRIDLDMVLDAHRRLLAGSRIEEHGGRVRDEQNWIGGSSYNPCSASFVPPPPEVVPELLGDLLAFCNGDDLPAVVQAAIAHAQFETIHPFVDGNGRIGRVLIHLVLRRRGVTTRVVPPISLVLATWSEDYIAGLTATRYRGASTSKAATDGVNRWVGTFAGACRRSIADAELFEQRVAELQAAWRERLHPVRGGSATDLLVRALPGAPVVTVAAAADLIGRSVQATNEAVARLVGADVLRQVTVGRRNRAFEAPELIATFTDLERQLASPAGDTRRSPPHRRVPRRRPEG